MDELKKDLDTSRRFEMMTYLDSMRAMYESAVKQNGELFDIATELTTGFSRIEAEAVITDSRIIKILRYCVAPSISQMKFGQFFGLSSITALEKDRVVRGIKVAQLKKIAKPIADFVNANLDKSRFLWLERELQGESLSVAQDYAKKWTCSLIADQNAQTEYRNWRKTLQEAKIDAFLVESGYSRSTYTGVVRNQTDIKLGQFSHERKVHGRTDQKADLVIRTRNTGRIVLIEAKAVGVKVDAFKRVKECCDKSRDWCQNEALGDVDVVAVIGGFFASTNIEALEAAGVTVIWEHRLSDLASHLQEVS